MRLPLSVPRVHGCSPNNFRSTSRTRSRRWGRNHSRCVVRNNSPYGLDQPAPFPCQSAGPRRSRPPRRLAAQRAEEAAPRHAGCQLLRQSAHLLKHDRPPLGKKQKLQPPSAESGVFAELECPKRLPTPFPSSGCHVTPHSDCLRPMARTARLHHRGSLPETLRTRRPPSEPSLGQSQRQWATPRWGLVVERPAVSLRGADWLPRLVSPC